MVEIHGHLPERYILGKESETEGVRDILFLDCQFHLSLNEGYLSDTMATVHLLCGRPGSGKTTFARELEETHKAVRYTYDEWMIQLYGRSPEQFEALFNRVSNLIWRIATRNLALGTDVILDKGFWRKRERENVRQAAAAIGAESKLYFLDAPIDVLRKRILTRSKSDKDALWINDQAFTEFINRFEPPGDDEDFILIRTG